MKVERGASQVLFGMLPAQTVDLQGRVWRVAHWTDPLTLPLDSTVVRAALLDAIAPWAANDTDGGLSAELRARAAVEVVGVNKERGVAVDSFPRQWRCRQCGRLTAERPDRCRCRATSISQMQFVAYHVCGALREPTLERCPAHHAVAVRLPGTATARELYFFCPDCNRPLSNGFPDQWCVCGKPMSVTVHRAGAVFTPQYAVLVNPPDPAVAARLRAHGGGASALEWVLDGMGPARPDEGTPTYDSFIDMLIQQGLSEASAREFADRALERGEIQRRSAGAGGLDIPPPARARAQEEALSINSAAAGGRVRIEDMTAGTTPPLQTLYQLGYPRALRQARLAGAELLTNFPVATLAFGYTRGGQPAGQSRLIPFRDRGGLRAYGSLNRTEALLFQLDPLAVAEHLRDRGCSLPSAPTPRDARLAILRNVEIPSAAEERPQRLGRELVTLLHSYAHRLVRALAAFSGIERDALAEYLIPHHLSVIIYASARGDFVLGGLQAVFETALDQTLDAFVTGETRCPLDPGCRTGGGACMACLHLGEPSCRWFNRYLDRAALFGPDGYLPRR